MHRYRKDNKVANEIIKKLNIKSNPSSVSSSGSKDKKSSDSNSADKPKRSAALWLVPGFKKIYFVQHNVLKITRRKQKELIEKQKKAKIAEKRNP